MNKFPDTCSTEERQKREYVNCQTRDQTLSDNSHSPSSTTMALSRQLKYLQTRLRLIPAYSQGFVHGRVVCTAPAAPFFHHAHKDHNPHEMFHFPRGDIDSRTMNPSRVHQGHASARFQTTASAAHDHPCGKSMRYQFDPSNHVHSHEELLGIGRQRWHAHHGRMHGHHGMNKLSYIPVLFGGLLMLLGVVPGLVSGRQSVSFNVEVERDGQRFSKHGNVTWSKGKKRRPKEEDDHNRRRKRAERREIVES